MPRPNATRGYLGEGPTPGQDIFPFYPTDLGECFLHLYRLARRLDIASMFLQMEQRGRDRRRGPTTQDVPRVRTPISKGH